jgi:3-hydroxyisobutyrate dehydrogenase-like beta-hydroxyacid dehydrogenase
MKIGFIGLGHMGAGGMAANLLRAGHEVTVYNRTPSKARPLVEQGARAAARVRDACRGDAVVTMLADDGAVESVVFGEKGVIRSLGKGAIHVSISSVTICALSSGVRVVGHPPSRRTSRPFLPSPCHSGTSFTRPGAW